MRRLTIATLLSAAMAAPLLAAEDRVLAYPETYRETFTRYYSGDRYLEAAQTITLYANEIARSGAQAGGVLPDGSVLVAEVYAAQTDANGAVIESALGRRLQGELKAIVTMERRGGWDDQYPEELKVGDWEFEVFSPTGENLGKDTTGCRTCHAPLGDTQYLWSLEHLLAAK